MRRMSLHTHIPLPVDLSASDHTMSGKPPAKRGRGRSAIHHPSSERTPSISAKQKQPRRTNPPPAAAVSESSSSLAADSPQNNMADDIQSLKETVAGLVSVVQHLSTSAARRDDTTAASTPPTKQTNTMQPDATGGDTTQTTSQVPLITTPGGEDIVEIAAVMQPSTSRPILLAAGLPAGANISDRNKVRIWTDKYVDFYDIIHTDATHTYHMALTTENSRVPSLQFSPRRRRPLTESEWCAAWDDYMAVYTLKHPTTLVDMITYAKSIKDLMKSGSDWRNYDQQFRSDREHNLCSWAAVRVDLQIAATLKPTNETRNNQPFRSSLSRQQTTPLGYCFDYHRPNFRCIKQNCKYKHLCARCGQQHPMFKQCSNTRTTGGSQQQQQLHTTPQSANWHNKSPNTGQPRSTKPMVGRLH